jgi:ADP-ribosyl-[dinitrogen reductase] hydrolase
MSPLIIYLKDEAIETRFKIVKEESSITHAHLVSVIACYYFVEFGIGLLKGKEKTEVYKELQKTIPDFLRKQSIS